MRTVPHPSKAGIKKLLETAILAARTAGRYAATRRDRRTETFAVMAHDVKLLLDAESQAVAEQVIRKRYPDHRILGEETADAAASPVADDRPEWIIDPIDGTVNFSHGLPFWCCSVAVRQGKTVLAGAVFAPDFGSLYSAAVGIPATCNGRRLHVSPVSGLRSALVMTGIEQKTSQRTRRPRIFKAISDNVQKTRVMGCAAMDICRVAAGEADAYFESGIYTWDVAAAGLIVEQAGGRIETLTDNGRHRLAFMATNGRIHHPLRRLILTAMGR